MSSSGDSGSSSASHQALPVVDFVGLPARCPGAGVDLRTVLEALFEVRAFTGLCLALLVLSQAPTVSFPDPALPPCVYCVGHFFPFCPHCLGVAGRIVAKNPEGPW